MTKPDRKSKEVHDDVCRTIKNARPDQIKRLLQDILKTATNDDSRPTGHA